MGGRKKSVSQVVISHQNPALDQLKILHKDLICLVAPDEQEKFPELLVSIASQIQGKEVLKLLSENKDIFTELGFRLCHLVPNWSENIVSNLRSIINQADDLLIFDKEQINALLQNQKGLNKLIILSTEVDELINICGLTKNDLIHIALASDRSIEGGSLKTKLNFIKKYCKTLLDLKVNKVDVFDIVLHKSLKFSVILIAQLEELIKEGFQVNGIIAVFKNIQYSKAIQQLTESRIRKKLYDLGLSADLISILFSKLYYSPERITALYQIIDKLPKQNMSIQEIVDFVDTQIPTKETEPNPQVLLTNQEIVDYKLALKVLKPTEEQLIQIVENIHGMQILKLLIANINYCPALGLELKHITQRINKETLKHLSFIFTNRANLAIPDFTFGSVMSAQILERDFGLKSLMYIIKHIVALKKYNLTVKDIFIISNKDSGGYALEVFINHAEWIKEKNIALKDIVNILTRSAPLVLELLYQHYDLFIKYFDNKSIISLSNHQKGAVTLDLLQSNNNLTALFGMGLDQDSIVSLFSSVKCPSRLRIVLSHKEILTKSYLQKRDIFENTNYEGKIDQAGFQKIWIFSFLQFIKNEGFAKLDELCKQLTPNTDSSNNNLNTKPTKNGSNTTHHINQSNNNHHENLMEVEDNAPDPTTSLSRITVLEQKLLKVTNIITDLQKNLVEIKDELQLLKTNETKVIAAVNQAPASVLFKPVPDSTWNNNGHTNNQIAENSNNVADDVVFNDTTPPLQINHYNFDDDDDLEKILGNDALLWH